MTGVSVALFEKRNIRDENMDFIDVLNDQPGNTTWNMTAISQLKLHVYQKIGIGVVGTILLLAGVFANAFVIAVLGIRKKRTTPGDKFLICSTVSEMICLISSSLLLLSQTLYYQNHWLYGKILCYLVPSLLLFSLPASAYFLLAVSMYRRRIISDPIRLSITSTRAYSIVALLCLSAGCLAAPNMAAMTFKDGSCYSHFTLGSNSVSNGLIQLVYYSVFSVMTVLIPVAVMIIVFVQCSQSLKELSEQAAASVSRWKRYREHHRAVLMFELVAISYTVTTSMYLTFLLVVTGLRYFSKTYYKSHARELYIADLVLLLALSVKSSVNPLIYCRMHREIRRMFTRGWQIMKRASTRVFRLTVVRERSVSAPTAYGERELNMVASTTTVFTVCEETM